jgi:hypothetical protein
MGSLLSSSTFPLGSEILKRKVTAVFFSIFMVLRELSASIIGKKPSRPAGNKVFAPRPGAESEIIGASIP